MTVFHRFVGVAPLLLGVGQFQADATLFLEKELPLTVLSVQHRESYSTYRLHDSEALTLIFSRPVIALGSDWKDSTETGLGNAPFHFESCEGWPTFQVPGKARWTTTSIVRFDPNIKWPTDLCFGLVVNATLMTYDGVGLLPGTRTRWSYDSEKLEMNLQRITSKTAHKATSGRWKSYLQDGQQEAPPDAGLALVFFPNFGSNPIFLRNYNDEEEPTNSDDIDHASIFKQLVGANRDILGADGESTYTKCGSNCLQVWPKTIAPGKNYRLILPKGSQPNRVSGFTREDIVVEFVGLQPFKFDSIFRSTQYRRQRLFLRHGVEGGNATEDWLREMAASIHIRDDKTGEEVQFTLRQLDKVTLLLDLPGLMPERNMTIEMLANDHVKDGFGQALEASTQGFTTQAVRDSFTIPRVRILYLRNLSRWEALSSGLCKNESNWSPVLQQPGKRDWVPWECPAPLMIPLTSLDDVLSFNSNRLSSALRFRADTLSIPSEKLLTKMPGHDNLQGLFAVWNANSRFFVSVASFGASVVPTRSGVLVWATRFEDGTSVPDVQVVLVRLNESYSSEMRTSSIGNVLARGKTDEQGLLHMPRDNRGNIAIFLEHPEYGLSLVESVPRFSAWTPTPVAAVGSVITDRSVYQPGDTVYIKGYLRAESGGKLVIPEVTSLNMNTDNVEVKVDPRFGTWSCQLKVPTSQRDGVFGFSLRSPSAQEGEGTITVSSDQLLVSEPRPPTVSMTLETTAKVVLPGSAAKLPVQLTTATYVGASVSGANVSIQWTVNRFVPMRSIGPREGIYAGALSLPREGSSLKDPPCQLQGTIALLADTQGKISQDLDIDALLKEKSEEQGKPYVPCREGDSVKIKATWVGPTREVVTKTLSGIRVSRSKWEIAVIPSSVGVGKRLPGRKYGVSAIVRDVEQGGREDVGGDFQLVASLHEWDGADLPQNLLPTSAWGEQVGEDCPLTSRSLDSLPECVGTLTMPEAKRYIVMVRGQDPEGIEIQTAFAIGRSIKEWSKEVVQDLDLELKLRSDKQAYRHGETMKLSFESPLGGDASLLVVWGPAEVTSSSEVPRTLVVRQSAASGEIEIPVDKNCRTACTVRVTLASGMQREEHLLPVKLPTSPLIDVQAPRGLSATLEVNIEKDEPAFLSPEEINIGIKAVGSEESSTIFEPGTEAEIEVRLPLSEAGSEVAIFMTDKAMLDVGGASFPHRSKNVSAELRSKLAPGTTTFPWYDIRSDLASTEGLEQTVETVRRREGVDPWCVAEGWTTMTSNGWLRDVEMSDEAFFSQRSGDLNSNPGYSIDREYSSRGGIADDADMAVPEAMPMAASNKMRPMARLGDSLRGPPPSDSGVQISARTHFVTTPLFAPSVIVGSDGVARQRFKFPDNVGTFQVRVYVVDGKKESRFVTKQDEVTVRRRLTLQPSIPRVARPGDTFEAGVLLTVHEMDGSIHQGSLSVGATVGGEQDGSVRLNLDGEAASRDDQSVFRSVDPHRLLAPQEVLFPFEVPAFNDGGQIGITNLSFVAYQEQKVLDSLTVPMTVKPDQAPVTVATSSTIPATPTGESSAKEGIELPQAVPGSGSVEITASVGHLNAALAASEPFLPVEGVTSYGMLGRLLSAAALRSYLDHSKQPSPSPESLGFRVQQVVGAADEAVRFLEANTDKLGLRLDERRSSYDKEKDYALNLQGCRVATLLRLLFPDAASVNQKVTDSWQLVVEESLTRQWNDLVHIGCDAEVNRTRSFCQWTWQAWWESLAQASVCLGREGLSRITQTSKTLFSNEGIVRNFTIESKAHFLLGLQMESSDGSVESIAQVVLKKIPNWIRITGRSAYITSTPRSRHSAGIHINGLFLLALSLIDPTRLEAGLVVDRLVEGLAQRLRPSKRTLTIMASGSDQGWAAAALSKYDESRDLTRPDLLFFASSGSEPLIREKIDSEHLGTSKEVDWDTLPSPPPPLKFSAKGSGEVLVISALKFIPLAPAMTGSIYRGILVEKVVRKACPISGNPVGPPLQVAPLGTVVVLSIQITTPDDLNSVIVEDYPSGGLEPLDPALEPAGRTSKPFPFPLWERSRFGARTDDMGGVFGGVRFGMWFNPFQTVSIRPDVAQWKSSGPLSAGSYTVTYRAVATTRGAFSLPSARAFSADEEEVMGLSRAGSFVVAEEGKGPLPHPADESAVAAFLRAAGRSPQALVEAPKPCKDDCPNGGVCRPDVGKCGCYIFGILKDGDCDPSGNGGVRGLPKEVSLAGEDSLSGRLAHRDDSQSAVSPWAEVTVVAVLALLLVSGITVFAKHYAGSWPSDFDNFEGTPYTASLEHTGSEIEMAQLVRGRVPSPSVGPEEAQGRGRWL